MNFFTVNASIQIYFYSSFVASTYMQKVSLTYYHGLATYKKGNQNDDENE